MSEIECVNHDTKCHHANQITSLVQSPQDCCEWESSCLSKLYKTLHICDRIWENNPLRAQYDFSVQVFLGF